MDIKSLYIITSNTNCRSYLVVVVLIDIFKAAGWQCGAVQPVKNRQDPKNGRFRLTLRLALVKSNVSGPISQLSHIRTSTSDD